MVSMRGKTTPLMNIAKGDYGEAVSIVQKFGSNDSVGTTYTPVTANGSYPTPQVSGATALRVKAGGNAADDAAGAGARAITLQGLDQTGAFASETIDTAGASASAATTTTFIRLFRAFVASSGTYASQTAGSHAAGMTIENAAGTEDWTSIIVNSFPRSQSLIGAYTVPLGKIALVQKMQVYVDSNKSTDILFFQRSGILQTAPPYDAMRAQVEFPALVGGEKLDPDSAWHFDELTDIGFMAKVQSGTAAVSVDFEIVLFNKD